MAFEKGDLVEGFLITTKKTRNITNENPLTVESTTITIVTDEKITGELVQFRKGNPPMPDSARVRVENGGASKSGFDYFNIVLANDG